MKNIKKVTPHLNIQSRRGFFKSMIGESISVINEFQGTPQFRLSDLWELPDHVLAQLKPMQVCEFELEYEQQKVYAIFKDIGNRVFLFYESPENIFVLRKFSKNLTIDEIGKKLSDYLKWDQAKAFKFVRDLFLSLVELKVVVPSNPIVDK